MRIAITGATGNLGTALLRRLSSDGHELVGLARRVPEPGAPEPVGWPRVAWHAVDLTDDASLPTLEAAFAGADAVVHLAWGFQPSHDLAYLRELGVGGTRRVLQAVTAAGVPHLVHMSSVGAYSPKADDAPVAEDWPTHGVPTSRYSRHKAAAERLLDEHEAAHDTRVTRVRPGIVGQRAAASALMRYGLPAVVPGAVIDLLPVLPLDRGFTIPVVHADDVADLVARAVEQRAGGAFNVAADPPLTAALFAEVLGAKHVHVPSGLMRPLVSASWHLHLQQVDTGWFDLAFAVPLVDTTRARTELGWAPTHDAAAVMREVVEGMRDRASGPTPALRPRSVVSALADAVRRGPAGQRHLP